MLKFVIPSWLRIMNTLNWRFAFDISLFSNITKTFVKYKSFWWYLQIGYISNHTIVEKGEFSVFPTGSLCFFVSFKLL